MLSQRTLLAVVSFSIVVSAKACLWDRDTLVHEATEMPDVITVATGRFERNPPLYYQMRIDREMPEVKAHRERLDLNDYLAVAYDRLAKIDLAIEWIERKHSQMGDLASAVTIDGNRDALSEAAYRYFANAGTFWIQRWIMNGANKADIKQATHAR